jgi:hypothetical protein
MDPPAAPRRCARAARASLCSHVCVCACACVRVCTSRAHVGRCMDLLLISHLGRWKRANLGRDVPKRVSERRDRWDASFPSRGNSEIGGMTVFPRDGRRSSRPSVPTRRASPVRAPQSTYPRRRVQAFCVRLCAIQASLGVFVYLLLRMYGTKASMCLGVALPSGLALPSD